MEGVIGQGVKIDASVAVLADFTAGTLGDIKKIDEAELLGESGLAGNCINGIGQLASPLKDVQLFKRLDGFAFLTLPPFLIFLTLLPLRTFLTFSMSLQPLSNAYVTVFPVTQSR